MFYQTHKLANGFRLIHVPDNSDVAYCGLIVNAGSRDEAHNELGMAHFIEHSIFKGTKKRKAYQIINRLENVGGELNAYTTKEETCIYGVFLKNHYERAIELISDMIFNSAFTEKELEKEKEVIFDEINSYKDSPSELIFDEFEELIFKGHPLGNNILGTEESISAFTKKDIINFIEKHYCVSEMLLCSVGNIEFEKLKKLTEKYFGEVVSKPKSRKRKKFEGYKPVNIRKTLNTNQTHCMIGSIAYDANHKKRAGLILLNNILGGQGMNSRLNVALREKHGYTYNVESSYNSYADTGIIVIYFGTDKQKTQASIDLTLKEFEKLKNNKLGVIQLKRAKEQMIGQLAISAENKENLLLNAGKSYLQYGKVDSIKDVAKKINAITANELIEIANDILNNKELSVLIYE